MAHIQIEDNPINLHILNDLIKFNNNSIGHIVPDEGFFIKEFQKKVNSTKIPINEDEGYDIGSYSLSEKGELELKILKQKILKEYTEESSYSSKICNYFNLNNPSKILNLNTDIKNITENYTSNFLMESKMHFDQIDFLSWIEKRISKEQQLINKWISTNTKNTFTNHIILKQKLHNKKISDFLQKRRGNNNDIT
ncbi:hypothetical protein HOK68_02600 [Candidatus Woesearchaeota archaeon]|jgi:hypothetical protein|nr:hypothetical protein [Candidatus Woesearchaeota archaeon]MBT4387958.1 hypothetical protein [Candidatus Woesearchaeota archaeon]MBT4595302.1 hypothetical protein [Candidatus Woesearchaeota archaeon]MBT5741500.1 hypothetical protein [Candidatus Woesearchaeota archaeon]MBT6505642.1 hypothetical protein [Candidatus Woesearchaeota archaeon]